jgi:MoaA/NifB/PqqE/SkfB family radical SAM enzyme
MDNVRKNLNTIFLLLKPNSTGKDFTVPQSKLSVFLKRYIKWLLTSQNANAEEFLGSVDLAFMDIFSLFDKSIELLKTIESSGFYSSIHVCFKDLIEHKKEMDILNEKRLVNEVNVHFSEEDLPYKKYFENELKGLFKNFGNVQLHAVPEILERFDVYSSEVLNKNGLTFIPQPTSLPVTNAPKYPVCACRKRFQLFVNEKGDIYPCQGLAGVEKYAIGHVSDKTFDHYCSYKCAADDFQTLVEKGPTLKRVGKTIDESYPWMCRRHLYEITKQK